MSLKRIACLSAGLIFSISSVLAGPVLHWSFDQEGGKTCADAVAGRQLELRGNIGFGAGVRGRSFILDGLTSMGVLGAGKQPSIAGPFTVETWVALGAYPMRCTAIVDLHPSDQAGFLFGIDAHGRPMLGLRAGEAWQSVTARENIPLRQWHHVAAVFDAATISLYLDGRQVASQAVKGSFVPATNLDLLVGRYRTEQQPEGPVRPDSTGVVFDFLDGALDDLTIYGEPLTQAALAEHYKGAKVPADVPLPPRVLPSGPPGRGPFGAFYTHLKFYPQWDDPWRVGEYADVVVRFDEAPIRFVFWRGTSYIPNWVTENGIWYNNEFTETWTGVKGCGEPMSDKQCKFSHVRILENSPARAVVHWRYALVDVFYTQARLDPTTGWGDWTDEVYTIYPDGTSVREITLHSTHPEEPHEWQESIVVMGPGFSPDNSLDPAGVTLVDAAAQSATYSWEHSTPPAKPGKPAHPCIQVINTKSHYRPFAIVRPQDNPDFDVYAGEIRRDVTIYPWWNHWPAATIPSDGRYAMAADRPSHSSLTHLFWDAYQKGPQWMRKIMLAGLTDQAATNLLGLARSWSHPAELKVTGGNFQSEGYDPAQKAYVLTSTSPTTSPVQIELAASQESPVINPAFVVKNWGEAEPKLSLNGVEIPPGTQFRVGHRNTLEGSDLIVWLRLEQASTCSLKLQAPDLPR